MKFLGRTLDERTMTYSYSDGSGGKLPEEMRNDVLDTLAVRRADGFSHGSTACALVVMWNWKKRLGLRA